MEVLLTGGDTELGRTIAEGFRDDGHRVVIAGARRDELEVAAKELDVDSIVFDNTDAASLEDAQGCCSPTTSTPSSTCLRHAGRTGDPAHLHADASGRRHGASPSTPRCCPRC